MKTLADILNYSPVQPGFGTSGVRALVEDLTDFEVYCLTIGTLRYFENKQLLAAEGVGKERIRIPVGCDLRPSSARLTRATLRAIQDCGYQTEYLGPLPTPALTCYGLHIGVASFMITGSHIPLDRNGQKANRFDGEVMKTDEQGIVAEVNAVRVTSLNGAAEDAYFDADGMIKPEQNPSLPAQSNAAELHYLQRYQSVFPAQSLTGLRVVFFEYSAVGRDLLPMILRNAGVDVVCMGRSDLFFPIDTEALSNQHLQELTSYVADAQKQHGRIDALISTDGDSDRPLVLAVKGSKGDTHMQSELAAVLRFIPGDLLGLMVSDYLGVDSISVPVSSTPAVQEYSDKQNIPIRITKIGSPFVIDSMLQAKNQGRHRVVSWEANGGYLTGSELSLTTGRLAALPTRDAILPILSVLHASVKRNQSLYEMVDEMPAWFGKAGLVDNFPQHNSAAILRLLSPDNGLVSASFQRESDAIIFRDRDFNQVTQHSAESEQTARMVASKRILETVFSQKHGFGRLVQIQCLDGIRCYFDNEDVAHIRPSGNAPQMRIYAYARTQKRADEIVALGIAEPNGFLIQLAKLVEGS